MHSKSPPSNISSIGLSLAFHLQLAVIASVSVGALNTIFVIVVVVVVQVRQYLHDIADGWFQNMFIQSGHLGFQIVIDPLKIRSKQTYCGRCQPFCPTQYRRQGSFVPAPRPGIFYGFIGMTGRSSSRVIAINCSMIVTLHR